MMDSSHPKYAEHLEKLKTWQGLPVTVGDLERIIGAARTMTESLDGIPASRWWPALVLCTLNTAESLTTLLALPADAYERDTGILRIGPRRIHLHAHTANALEALRSYEREMLFPWPKDGRKPPYFMLYHDYQDLLHRAGLPPLQKRPLAKLRKLGERYPEVLDCIDANRPFHPVAGKPERNRKRKLKRRRPRVPYGVHLIGDDSADTLRKYFAEVYEPIRLIGCSQRTIDSYRSVVNGFSAFLGCDATLHHLNDDRLGEYKAWMARKDYSPTTINGHLRHLLSLWRHAWKKRRVDELPRDVDFLNVPKHCPEAWSLEEMGRMLDAAGKADGEFLGMPANLFWPAFLLTIYDTGLRLGAVLQIRTQDFNLETGELIARAETQKQLADQIFRVHAETLEAIRAINPQLREFVFNYAEYNRNKRILYSAFDRILKAAGLPTSSRDKFHRIRRTSASLLADALGGDEAAAMKHLGHSSVQITMGYLDPRKIKKTVGAADLLPRPRLVVEINVEES